MTRQEIRDWYRVREGYWFRPKLFGWGAVPVTWQGWLLTLGLVAVAVPVARLAATRGLLLLVLIVPLVIGFTRLSWAMTDGEWKWRWGARR
ncbi:hypothetical protein OF829_03170 [Sphingomonas sp. LB-2]|uniref:hypothetical protein n=1 Tax=Sphingomonas caeni TaxID=2984949 RepID=UPI0022303731|nr:hypothetical protein [Sphingomonas caeni]MCW3846225.1 hypothetical protein [Sphingomonas caeni]